MNDEVEVDALYHHLLRAWDQRQAKDFAALFVEAGHVVGFDGSVMDSRAAIEAELTQIFGDHPTPPFIAKVRKTSFSAPGTALLSAVAGMVPPGRSELEPKLNAVQTLVAVKEGGQWRIALFQNTPAAFHGRPELAEQLTAELRAAAGEQSGKSESLEEG